MDSLQVGRLVEHRVWGRGKVLALSPPNVQAYFPSLASDGGPVRLVRRAALTVSPVQSDPALDYVTGNPKASRSAGSQVRTPPKRPAHDLAKAIEWFELEYPGRFSDDALVRDEIKHKRDAHDLFEDRLGGGKGRELLAAGNFPEAATLLTVLYQSTNIPSRFEAMAAHDGLKVPEAGARLLDALLGLLESPGPDAFARLAAAVGSLPAPAESSRVLTWPNVTILPFLAAPDRFIVTKPEITKQVAGRMGIDLLYSTAVKWDTYARVLDMSRRLLEMLAPLGAKDFIDVQSFVWLTRGLS